ncbi:hypothetical protein GCM10009754_84390 [Amycolatopsis minnesotensis]|uniref:Uncharacterized protein n=1 Tax=Amycolatopsis minnesotensis TaxID=337894 RepID=A0ABP5E8C5_9PSEU
MFGQRVLAAVDRADQRGRAGRPGVLAGPLFRTPAAGKPVLRRGKVVGELLVPTPLLLVRRLPPLALGEPALAVTRVTAAVGARPAVAGRVEVEHRGDDIGEQGAVVAHQHHAARVLAQPVGEVGEPVRVEVVGRLVEQEQVVPRAEQARQAHPVALPDRQGGQPPAPVVDGAERGE